MCMCLCVCVCALVRGRFKKANMKLWFVKQKLINIGFALHIRISEVEFCLKQTSCMCYHEELRISNVILLHISDRKQNYTVNHKRT